MTRMHATDATSVAEVSRESQEVLKRMSAEGFVFSVDSGGREKRRRFCAGRDAVPNAISA